MNFKTTTYEKMSTPTLIELLKFQDGGQRTLITRVLLTRVDAATFSRALGIAYGANISPRRAKRHISPADKRHGTRSPEQRAKIAASVTKWWAKRKREQAGTLVERNGKMNGKMNGHIGLKYKHSENWLAKHRGTPTSTMTGVNTIEHLNAVIGEEQIAAFMKDAPKDAALHVRVKHKDR